MGAPPLCSGCDQDRPDAMDMSIHFHHVHMKVADLDRTLSFYETHLKLQKIWLNGSTVALHANPGLILLDKSPAPVATLPTALQHIGWGSKDTGGWYEAAHAKGVAPDTRGGLTQFNTKDTPTIGEPGSGMTNAVLLALLGMPACLPIVDPFAYIYVLGPDQERIEMCSGIDERINHLHFTTADLMGTARWYQRFVGRAETASPIGLWGLYLDDVMFAFEQVGEAADYAPTDDHVLSHVAFSVSNLDAWLQRLRDQKVEIVSEPAVTLGFKSFFARGPDGMLLELVQASRSSELCMAGSSTVPPSRIP
jgi:catechol 2,3-dioxygenase-like lactoylglutathione lyase family enzyme